LRVIRNTENSGFLVSCNGGAAEASGDFLVFLNNDVEVQPGWLEALLDAAGTADVGAVGSKLIYPDGRLQEAGGIIWSDATGTNYGRNDDPSKPQYNFRRDTDYCSAASLLVRRDLFAALGGFDERFAPAYYEDADLCFAIRAAGYRVLYEPRSVVIHYEGASHGTDERPGLPGAFGKSFQHRNRHNFRAKWANALMRHRPPGAANGYLGGYDRGNVSVLVADTWVPTHDRDAGSLRMSWILRLLRELGCDVTLFPLSRARPEPYTSDLQAAGIDVEYGPATFAQLAVARRDVFDMVLLSRPNVAWELLDQARLAFSRATLVYDTVDLHHVRAERRAEHLGEKDALSVELVRRQELSCIRRADLTATVTACEARTVERAAPGTRTIVLPIVYDVDTAPRSDWAERADLLFIGGFLHDPNVDAALYLVNDILPLIQRDVDAHLWIVGSDPPPEVCRLESRRVTVTGHVPDVRDYFRKCRVFVSPIRYGAGMKGKNVHALAFGLPLVTTSVGAEGMELVDGQHALIRDDPAEFAAAVARVYRDPSLWATLAKSSGELVRERWSPAAMKRRLEQLLRAARPRPSSSAGSERERYVHSLGADSRI
jgi:glycosyltransferase involved in cell wall biosynthesis